MKINLSPHTVGTIGGGLRGNLSYLEDHIHQQLNNSAFQTSFDQLLIILSYPPMYVEPGMAGMESHFYKHYNTLPSVTMFRKFKRIEVRLQAPEFSEHFQQKEQKKYSHTFEIADEYKSITETDLAKIVIDKYLQALQLIQSKLKKDDVFDVGIFESVLAGVRQQISDTFLTEMHDAEKAQAHYARIELAEADRQTRSSKHVECDTLIRDIRLYYDFSLPAKLFYLNRYADLVLRQLIKKDFKCPQYHHLYISMADTREQALKRTLAVEDWFRFGVAVLPKETLFSADPARQQRLVLNAIREGLLDIASLDDLDKNKIEEAIKEAEEIGILSEILFKAKENNKILFAISLKTVFEKNEEEIFFTIVDKATGQTVRWKFGQENVFLIGGWFGTINVTNKKITIKPRAHMDLVLKDKEKIIEIDVLKELADPAKAVS